MQWKKGFSFGLMLVAAVAIFAGLTTGQEAKKASGKTYAIGDAVDLSISLKDHTGKAHTLSDYKGKVIVIDFWSTSCPWSKGYEARLMQLTNDFKGKDVVVLAIDSNSTETVDDIKKYAEDKKLPYPVLVDTGNVVADKFDAQFTPHIFIIDQKGTLRYVGGIDNDPKGSDAANRKEHAKNAVNALLEGKEVPEKNTKTQGCTIKRVKQG